MQNSYILTKPKYQRAIILEWAFIEFEEENMVLNNVTKFHKILVRTIRLREWTSLA